MEGESRNIFCVIQGPLLTFGQGPNNSIEGFNAINTVIANVAQLERRRIKFVVCTWRSDEHLVAEAPFFPAPNILLESPYPLDVDHRFKHHYAVKQGVEFLKERYPVKSSDMVVKIRTDMKMPDSFWNWLMTDPVSPEKLLVSELYHPFYLGDFVFAGTCSVLDDYLSVITGSYPKLYHPGIAFDLGLKYFSLFDHRKRLTNPLVNRIAFSFFSGRLSATWEKFIDAKLVTLPVAIWNEILWRDKPMDGVIKPGYFHFTPGPYNHRSTNKESAGTYRYFVQAYREKLARLNYGNLTLYALSLLKGLWPLLENMPDAAVLALDYDDGSLAKYLASKGVNCTRMKVDPAAPRLETTLPVNTILFFGLIERIDDPKEFILQCKRLLPQGGRLIACISYHGLAKEFILRITGRKRTQLNRMSENGIKKFWTQEMATRLLQEQGFKVTGFKGRGRILYLWNTMILSAVAE
ncbi:class I SAM-dependent methyltransferase [Hufsiella ginkgonis]|uniref:Methyltransferase domain-containing protein n=1 Tax=Hufsiella ginkgonis TaxID=2695274 RepID=A0A7K1Y2N0_9SPHI|nr:class I SAM-dependent methyltransferase [Hufsiella ginkgonis]MXV17472.1 hypothetical protein [Hufsiella ginkgonis]